MIIYSWLFWIFGQEEFEWIVMKILQYVRLEKAVHRLIENKNYS